MKPSPFTYHDPSSLSEALGLLGSLENAKLLAGGQSLGPMLNYRYVMPDHLVDLNKIAGLSDIQITGRTVRIGAMARQRVLERDPGLQKTVSPSSAKRCSRSATSRPATAAPLEEVWRILIRQPSFPGLWRSTTRRSR